MCLKFSFYDISEELGHELELNESGVSRSRFKRVSQMGGMTMRSSFLNPNEVWSGRWMVHEPRFT